MLRDLKNLYVAIANGRVVVFDTNLKDFVGKLASVEPSARNYDYYFREFKKAEVIEWNGYVLQKVL